MSQSDSPDPRDRLLTAHVREAPPGCTCPECTAYWAAITDRTEAVDHRELVGRAIDAYLRRAALTDAEIATMGRDRLIAHIRRIEALFVIHIGDTFAMLDELRRLPPT
jgi:hypothetical protein